MIFAIQCNSKTNSQYKSKVNTIHSFKRCDLGDLANELSNIPWAILDVLEDVDDKWISKKSLFLNVVDKQAPLTRFRSRQQSLCWISKKIGSLCILELLPKDVYIEGLGK